MNVSETVYCVTNTWHVCTHNVQVRHCKISNFFVKETACLSFATKFAVLPPHCITYLLGFQGHRWIFLSLLLSVGFLHQLERGGGGGVGEEELARGKRKKKCGESIDKE